MGTKRKTKADPPTVFPTLDEWERMPQQSKDTYLSQLQHPKWLSESELRNLTPNEWIAHYKSFRECELTQFLLYLAEQLSLTRKGMEGNIRAVDRVCNRFLEEHFPLPPATNRFQLLLPDLISVRENWIKACEGQKRADMELYYESRSGPLSPQQEALLRAAAGDAEIAAGESTSAKKAAEWTRRELERRKKNSQKTGRKNQRNGEKNDNGRKTDKKLKNQIITEVRQVMERNKCSQSAACRIVSIKHLKDDGTPIYAKRRIENWVSAANTKNMAKKP